MKTQKLPKNLLLLAILAVLISSCGVHYAPVMNRNTNGSTISITQNNFKVVKRVSGQSKATYILGIGGLNNKALIENAKADMLKSAELEGKSRVVIDVITEFHLTKVFPFYYQKTITVSGTLIEFTN